MTSGTDRLTAAVVALARYNIPTDIQELLVSGNPAKGIRPGALEAAMPPKIDARPMTAGRRFYGDPVAKFRAMADATYPSETIDGAHFRMWCGIAADEIEAAQKASRTNSVA